MVSFYQTAVQSLISPPYTELHQTFSNGHCGAEAFPRDGKRRPARFSTPAPTVAGPGQQEMFRFPLSSICAVVVKSRHIEQ